jgi:hypothetical protein
VETRHDILRATTEAIVNSRAERRARAVEQVPMLERMYRDIAESLKAISLVDPVTAGPIATVKWRREGYTEGLILEALGGTYVAELLASHDFGDRLVAVLKTRGDDTLANVLEYDIFGGTPVRMIPPAVLEVALPTGGIALLGHEELLERFLTAVAKREQLRG